MYQRCITVILLCLLLSPCSSIAQTFLDSNAALTGVNNGNIAWGDYDKDGDLDLAVVGEANGTAITKLYRNQNGTLVDTGTSLALAINGGLRWGDYDKDGELDLVIVGTNKFKIYRNDIGLFFDINYNFSGNYRSVLWLDYDNDGDQDILAWGSGSRLFCRNEGIGFTSATVSFSIPVTYFYDAFDFDGDGDTDLLGQTSTTPTGPATTVFLNNGGSFTDSGIRLPAGSASAADYDNDGDIDITVCTSASTRIYRNDNASFTDTGNILPGITNGSLAWGDCDNDGDQDILMAGQTTDGTYITKLYRTIGTGFEEIATPIPGLRYPSCAWGDYDADGDLDIAVEGYTGTSYITKVYNNSGIALNTPPTAPVELSTSYTTSDGIRFSWKASTDVETPASALTYNIRIGTTPGASDAFACMSDLSNGKRRVAALGPIRALSYNLKGLPAKTYYWSVQAVDASFAGSAWAAVQRLDPVVISGHIRTKGGVGIANVTITAENSSGSATTDINGLYYLNVYSGWNGKVTPNKSGYLFEPAERVYSTLTSNQLDQDYIGSSVFMDPISFNGISGRAAWGDYDSDGDPDIAFTGTDYTGSNVTRIYRNDVSKFTDIQAELIGPRLSCLAWGDYDNDGDLDLVLAGDTSSNGTGLITKLYSNDAGSFVDVNAGLVGVAQGSIVWGDYDNDGQLDLFIIGYSGNNVRTARVYHNDGGIFTDIGGDFFGLSETGAAWGDYDNDGDLDLVYTGYIFADNSFDYFGKLYRNDDGLFIDTEADIAGLKAASLAWGDYDNDGDLDLAAAGQTSGSISGGPPVTIVYRNDNGRLVDSQAGIIGTYDGSVAWGDIDNDGDLDLAVSGLTGTDPVVNVYRNDNGKFVDMNAGIGNSGNTMLAWADYDLDGKLDLLVGKYSTRIYKNVLDTANVVPNAPTNLSANVAGNVTLTWDAASDTETPTTGLSYNIRVGTAPGKADVFSGMANPSSGVRTIPAAGPGMKSSWILKGLEGGTYYYSVQAIDTAFAGSQWAAEQTLSFISISGKVTTADGKPVGGAVVTAGDCSVVSDASGRYSIAVASGWGGTVTISKSAFSFTPESRIYTNVTSNHIDQDYTAASWFEKTDSQLPPLGLSMALAWGDFDSDGDLDLATSGGTGSVNYTKIYRNDDGSFTDINANIAGVYSCSLAWGDYDNDGDLDLSIVGSGGSRIYRNDSGSFTDIKATLISGYSGSAAWGDYDNDGDLDLAASADSGIYTKIYRNDCGQFIDAVPSLQLAEYGSVDWGDYDNDGDLDLLVIGASTSLRKTVLYRNDSGSFVDSKVSLPTLIYPDAAWGDYDNDGDLDLVVSGWKNGHTRITSILRNDAGQFTDIKAGLIGLFGSKVAWGDYDNDGDLDIMVCGATGYSPTGKSVTRIYENVNGRFVPITTYLPQGSGDIVWGDYDNDGDLDLALAITSYGNPGLVTAVVRNGCSRSNSRPAAPTGLAAVFQTDRIHFSWNPASDAETPAAGLYYNLRVGTAPGKDDIFSGMADASGLRKLPDIGNVQQKLSWTIKHTVPGTCYWSVQAIDGAFAGSEWADQAIPVHSISGFVKTVAGKPIVGAVVSNDLGLTVHTDTNGYYALASAEGWSGTITVSKNLYTFDPLSRDYQSISGDISAQDYTGSGGFDSSTNVIKGTRPAWGDYDKDGDLDLAVGSIYIEGNSYTAKLFRNDNGTFNEVNAGITFYPGSCIPAWGDYDNDGDLDLMISGSIYKNSYGTFAKADQVASNSVAWVDYDNDGDLDILTTIRVLANNNGTFVSTGTTYQYTEGIPACADYDNDGDLDIMAAGKLYRNTGSGLVPTDFQVTGLTNILSAWGDYDNDGDYDIAISGSGSTGIRIYCNENGSFTDINAVPSSGGGGTPNWVDYDNDGDVDLAVGGCVYRNDNGVFTNIGTNIPGNRSCWGDYDGDGDIDLVMDYVTYSGGTVETISIYRNDCATVNQGPSVPKGLSAVVEGDGVTFTWNAASDDHTPVEGLSYNIRLGTSPGAQNLFAGMASPVTGQRYVAATGNAQNRLSWHIKVHVPSPYYWSVQAIDSAYAGGVWAVEKSIGAYTISGQMRNAAGKPISGVTVRSSSGTWAETDVNGMYAFSVPVGWSGTVSASKTLYNFQPASRSFDNMQNDVTGQDFIGGGGFCDTATRLKGDIPYWADYDSDGDLDLALSSETYGGNIWIYRNTSGSFTGIDTGKAGYKSEALAWGDYDRDGDLDMAAGGYVYRNTSGSFAVAAGPFNATYDYVPAWGDFDNDGDLDLSLGYNLYRNNGLSFISVSGIGFGASPWADFDNDGDMDIAGNGVLYRNNGGTFIESDITLSGLPAWGDYDNDGYLDAAVAGNIYGTPAYIYRNEGGTFAKTADMVQGSSLVWGDYDNDGDLDLAAAGLIDNARRLRIYLNNNGSFLGIDLESQVPDDASLAWGDCDNDGDLDLAVGGLAEGCRIYRNDCAKANTLPAPPSMLQAESSSAGIVFNWNAASDAETPPTGLSYNLRVGTRPGAQDIFSGMAATSGFRRLPALGNAQKRLSWTINAMPAGIYYWSVQGIDSAYAGSHWAQERTFVVGDKKIASAKNEPDGTVVVVSSCVVTAAFDGFFYIEADDRSSGIRVEKASHGISEGMRVTVTGTMGTITGERIIRATSVIQVGNGSIRPLEMNNDSLGGGQCGLQGAVWSWRWIRDPNSSAKPEYKWLPATGLNNIGMLVKTTGKVTHQGTGFFYLDDGSALDDGTGYKGVKVHGQVPVESGQTSIGRYVSVIGISSCDMTTNNIIRVIRTRNYQDIIVIK